MNRCWWCEGDPVYENYHDNVWGKPERDERKLFEMLSLELFQSGLSWITILRKKDAFKRAFANWDIEKIAAFGDEDVARLMGDAGIVRNRKKIQAVMINAGLYFDLKKEFGSLAGFLERFKPENPPTKAFTRENLPLILDEARAMSKTLKGRGFSFTGPMVCMSLMQAVGIVNHHVEGCDLAIS